MAKFFTLLLIVVCTNVVVAPDALAQQRAPTREPFEDAVDRGLEWLSKNQSQDGSWMTGRAFGNINQGRGIREPAVTALAVMAFLSAGHVPGEGKYAEVIDKGIRYVTSSQHRNGLFAAQPTSQTIMYSHGICTLMLAEVIGMINSREVADRYREQLVAAIKLIRAAQCTNGLDSGGWRYRLQSLDSDISVTGWQVMALRAARNVGCDIPTDTIDGAVEYIKRCHDPLSGGYRYMRSAQVTVPCTGTSVLALELCGKEFHLSLEARRAGSYILRTENRLTQNRPHFFYGIYYTSQAMFQLGGGYWASYRKVLHQLLLSDFSPAEGGYWTSDSWDDRIYGVNYCTAMAVLALTVEYRFLPIYQRNEEPETPDED
ncbi:MAG: prenyltransferase/squalene oxidase repeat-containing protein [Zavarzinella sp.]